MGSRSMLAERMDLHHRGVSFAVVCWLYDMCVLPRRNLCCGLWKYLGLLSPVVPFVELWVEFNALMAISVLALDLLVHSSRRTTALAFRSKF